MFVRALAMIVLGTFAVVYADTITLKDGRTISGSYLGGDARQIRMAVGDRVQSFSVTDVSRVEFGSVDSMQAPTAVAPVAPAAPPAPASPPSPPTPPRETLKSAAAPDSPAAPAAPPAPSAGQIEFPAGTSVTVRLIDAVDSQKDKLGQTYRANLDEPLMINGEAVVPRGADVVAKLVDDKQSGKLEGKTVLTLDLQSITVNGRTVDIDTQEVSQASDSRLKRTGVVVGGLTALGAIVGGIAGGGKGAAIGAVSGAGAGTAAQVMTKGQRVFIPSETRLTFSLQQPLRI
jgi:hypothetical protein